MLENGLVDRGTKVVVANVLSAFGVDEPDLHHLLSSLRARSVRASKSVDSKRLSASIILNLRLECSGLAGSGRLRGME